MCFQELSLHFSADVTLPDFDGLEYLSGKQAKVAYLNFQKPQWLGGGGKWFQEFCFSVDAIDIPIR